MAVAHLQPMVRSLAIGVALVPLVLVLAFVGGLGLASSGLRGSTGGDPTSGDMPCVSAIHGALTLAQANIPTRSGLNGFRASMPRVLSHHPDFVTLNEQSARSLGQIRAAAPGYAAYRNRAVPGGGRGQAFDEVVLYRTTWRLIAGGRILIVRADHTRYGGHPVVWDRYATWAILQRAGDGAIVSVISVHHMTDPAKYGPHKPLRQRRYAAGMDRLLGLVHRLEAYGLVFVGGDFNVHANQISAPWTAPAKMRAAGYAWYTADLDYLFYPSATGVRLVHGWSGPMASDHPWISATVEARAAGRGARCPDSAHRYGAARHTHLSP